MDIAATGPAAIASSDPDWMSCWNAAACRIQATPPRSKGRIDMISRLPAYRNDLGHHRRNSPCQTRRGPDAHRVRAGLPGDHPHDRPYWHRERSSRIFTIQHPSARRQQARNSTFRRVLTGSRARYRARRQPVSVGYLDGRTMVVAGKLHHLIGVERIRSVFSSLRNYRRKAGFAKPATLGKTAASGR